MRELGKAGNSTYRAGAEKLLVEAIDDFWEDGRAWRGGSHDVHHAKRLEASDERTGISTKGERIAPEHPLKGNAAARLVSAASTESSLKDGALSLHCNDHQRLEEKRQG